MYLERLTLILEIIGQKGAANVAEICTHSDLPKASAYRLVQDLVAVGLIDPASKGYFTLGARLKRIAQTDQSDLALIELIGPTLKRAASAHGVAFFLSRLRGKAVEIIHVTTPDTGVSYLHPGLGKRPLHACSCSKAVVAFNPALDLTGDLEGRLRAYTEFTTTKVEDLQAELALIRTRGYAECVEEIERGMCSVAAPLGHGGTGATLAIGATASLRVFTPQTRAKTGTACIALAAEIASILGTETRGEPATRVAASQ